ncbi:hypothetical protein L7F22_056980 [Adiantum nelumboides]|nr:hypothetical protein [Adiantum nelumboides]
MTRLGHQTRPDILPVPLGNSFLNFLPPQGVDLQGGMMGDNLVYANSMFSAAHKDVSGEEQCFNQDSKKEDSPDKGTPNDRKIIGLCHGARPSMEALRTWMSQNWSIRNINVTHVQYLPNGYYLFFCADPNSALQIVIQGQWLMRNTPTSVFNWYIGFNPRGLKPSKALVWVDFINLPVELYPWLKLIGSFVGRVLGQSSRGGINPTFDPQLLIEIDLSKDLIYTVPIQDSNGKVLHNQKVVYKSLPNACFNCMKVGHFIKDCPDLKPNPPPSKNVQEKKEEFQTVAKKIVPKLNKGNKASSSRYRNSFSPLLEDVFDPFVYDNNVVQQESIMQDSGIARAEDPQLNNVHPQKQGPSKKVDKEPLPSFQEKTVKFAWPNIPVSDQYVYNITIDSFGKHRQAEKALKIFKIMKDNDIQHDTVSWNSLIDCLFRAGKKDKALQLFNTMKAEGCSPNSRTFNISCNPME